MRVWTLVKKDLLLLLRDRMAGVLLLGMPILFILILGLLLGEGFGEKADDRLRVALVDQDAGLELLTGTGAVGMMPAPQTGPWQAVGLMLAGRSTFPGETWSKVVQRDLAETAEIRIEVLPSEEQARELVRNHKRAAVLIFQPTFSVQVNRCSFLVGGINPFHRDGVLLPMVGVELLKDSRQPGTAAVIDQVAQVTLLRVLLPWMIGRAFDRLSDPDFITILGQKVRLPVPRQIKEAKKMLKSSAIQFAIQTTLPKRFSRLLRQIEAFGNQQWARSAGPGTVGMLASPCGGPLEAVTLVAAGREVYPQDRIQLGTMLDMASGGDPKESMMYNKKVGSGVQEALGEQFKKYNLRGKTWAALTKARNVKEGGAEVMQYRNRDGSGFLKRGAHRYQILVPSYTVMFAFFLVLTVGWVFVAERRQGTLRRLQAAPLTRGEILLGKLIPCFALSVGQGAFLLLAGRLLFGMRWGPEDWSLLQQVGWLLMVVFSTSLAAIGLAMLVAALARTELQVALYGAVPVLVLALIGGCVLPREMMPANTRELTLLTPHGWALNAYSELLTGDAQAVPNLEIVLHSCAVLVAFGAGFLGFAWWWLRLD